MPGVATRHVKTDHPKVSESPSRVQSSIRRAEAIRGGPKEWTRGGVGCTLGHGLRQPLEGPGDHPLAVLGVLLVTAVSAQDLQLWLNPTLGQAMLRSDYRIMWYPEQRGGPTARRPRDVSIHIRTLTFPIWQSATDEWTFSGRVRLQDYDTRAVLPDSQERFPGELWDIRAGFGYRHKFDNGWIAAIGASIGSASDRPFASEHELIGRLTGLLRVPHGDRNAWLFTLNYASDQEILGGIPVPGVAYLYVPNERFRAVVGFPFTSVEYKPIPSLTLDAYYVPVRRVRARITYEVALAAARLRGLRLGQRQPLSRRPGRQGTTSSTTTRSA